MNNLNNIDKLFKITVSSDAVENRCSNSTDTLEYDCNSGRIFDIENKKQTGFCDCYYKKLRDIELMRLDKMFPSKITKAEHVKMPHQRDFAKSIMPDKKGQFYEKPEKGVCVYGASGRGKTHMIYKYLQTMIQGMETAPSIIVKTADDLLKLWRKQYNEDSYEAEKELNNLTKCDFLVLDNLDWIGTVTEAKQQEIFALFNKLEYSDTLVYVTLNLSLEEFSDLFPTNKNGNHSIMNRIKEQCNIVDINYHEMKQGDIFK